MRHLAFLRHQLCRKEKLAGGLRCFSKMGKVVLEAATCLFKMLFMVTEDMTQLTGKAMFVHSDMTWARGHVPTTSPGLCPQESPKAPEPSKHKCLPIVSTHFICGESV